MTPDDPRHGKPAGETAHYRAGQKPCEPCRRAAMRRKKRSGLYPPKCPAIGSRRRVQALQALGYSRAAIAHELGYKDQGGLTYMMRDETETMLKTTAARVAEVYERLSMTVPVGRGASRARNDARRNGYVPPLAWNDIDDPDEQPNAWSHQPRSVKDVQIADEYDEVVVLRILDGDYKVPSTAAEKREVINRWPGSMGELRRLTGWHVWRYMDGAA